MNKALKLNTLLFGLRNAAKMWFETVSKKVKSFGLTDTERRVAYFTRNR